MNVSREALETSYRCCRQISRRAGSNLRTGFWLLPREKRHAMDALYAFMRHTDDLADDLPPGPPQQEALVAWRAALQQALSSGPNQQQSVPLPPFPLPPSLPSAGKPSESGLSILPALADTAARFAIPHEHLLAVIDGVEMDLDGRQYETFDALQTYCHRVASAVGLACIHIWGFRGPEAVPLAAKAGVALQLTNILRDLKQDADARRVYLPLADLRACDYSVADLLAGVADQRFERLMALEIGRAEGLYAEAAELLEWLDPPGRRLFGLMTATYRSLLRKIARRPADVFLGRVRPGRWQKLGLVVRWAVLPPRKAALR
jgi:15-cis-phytoene synthase